MIKRVSKSNITYAACVVEINSATNEVQLFPAGLFRARDGRPKDMAGWVMNESAAMRIIAQASQRQTPYIIDYEHQTLRADENGQPAPRAATFTQLEWRPGIGLFAIDVKWTARAKQFIDDDEYGFISPVFPFNSETGEVLGLMHAALTNDPAIDGMADVAAARYSFNQPHSEEHTVNEALLKMLGLDKDASEEQIQQAIVALKAKAGVADSLTTALGAKEGDDVVATVTALKSATKGGKPDPAEYVPVSVVTELQSQVAALTTQFNSNEVDELVTTAMSDGKLLPAQETWARDLGKSNVAALKAYIKDAPQIAALKGSQTGGNAPDTDNKHGLSDEEVAVCKNLDIPEEDYAKGKE